MGPVLDFNHSVPPGPWQYCTENEAPRFTRLDKAGSGAAYDVYWENNLFDYIWTRSFCGTRDVIL